MNYTQSLLCIVLTCFAIQQCKSMDHQDPYNWIGEFTAAEGMRLSRETNQLAIAIQVLLRQNNDLSQLPNDQHPLLNTLLYKEQNLSAYLPQLLEKKANPNVTENNIGIVNDPLGNALLVHNIPAAYQLIEAGANTNIFGPVGYPLNYAISNGNLELLIELLEHDADPNIPDRVSKKTPLMKAVEYGNDYKRLAQNRERIVSFLLVRGADKTMCNAEEKTALDIARSYLKSTSTIGNPTTINRKGYEAVIKLLEK